MLTIQILYPGNVVTGEHSVKVLRVDVERPHDGVGGVGVGEAERVAELVDRHRVQVCAA